MNGSQTVFALFFAIFWGGILNVSWRWQMFQPLWFPRILLRVVLSVVLMMVLPIAFFALQVKCSCSVSLDSGLDIVAAVLPALSVFGFYRFWMFVVGRWPKTFYWSEEEPVPDYRLRSVDPSTKELCIDLNKFGSWGNLAAAVIYWVVAVWVPWTMNQSGLMKCI